MRELALLPALVAIMVAGTIASPAFLTTQNLTTVVQFSAALGLLVVGESLILIFGELDLSLQSIYGLAPMLAAYLTVHPNVRLGIVGSGTDLPPAVGLLVLLAVGAVVGLFNSVLVVKLRMNAFILGLAMLILLAGLQQGVPNDATSSCSAVVHLHRRAPLAGRARRGLARDRGVPRGGSVPSVSPDGTVDLRDRREHRGGPRRRNQGRPDPDRLLGVRRRARRGRRPDDRGTGGCGDGQPGRYAEIIFTVFAAAVIGGISLDGGKGRMVGAFTGVLLLSLVQNVLQLANVVLVLDQRGGRGDHRARAARDTRNRPPPEPAA